MKRRRGRPKTNQKRLVSDLVEAIYNQDVAEVRYLIDQVTDIDQECDETGWSPLEEACLGASVEIVELILERGADVNAAGGLPFRIASGNGDRLVSYNIMLLLLSHPNCDVNRANEDGHTPLMGAAEAGNLVAVQLLLDHGADADFRDESGCTALDCALLGSERDHRIIAELLKNRTSAVQHHLQNLQHSAIDVILSKFLASAETNTVH